LIEELYQKARNGDTDAESQLFKRLSARFALTIRRKVWNTQDCEEIAQDAVTAILQNYRKTVITSSFSAWAQRVVENKIADYYRATPKRQRESAELTEQATPAGSWTPDPNFRMALLECLRKVNAINKRHARMLVLSFQGLAIEEICARMGLTRSNAYSVLSRARSMLARCLEKGDVK
jgi:RNA polymerase sigma factor (sigma-70 family)